MSYDIIWPFLPDWGNPVTATLSYLSSVREVQSGIEYRERLRTHPRRSLEFSIAEIGHDAQVLDAVLWGQSVERWMVPMWWDVAIAYYDEPGGAWTFRTDGIIDGREWVEGQWLVAEKNGQLDAVKIDDLADDLDPDTIILDEEPDESVQADNVRIYPGFIAAADPEQSHQAVTALATSGTAGFELIDYEVDESSSLDLQYQGADVFDERPDRDDPPDVTYVRSIDTVDFEVGVVARYDDPSSPTIDRSHVYVYDDKSAVMDIRHWLQSIGGRHEHFWRPTDDSDMTILEVDGTDIDVHPVHWSDRYQGDRSREHLYFRIRSDDPEIREIVSSSTPSDGVETLTLDSPLDVDLDDIQQVCWLEKVRLASDDISIDWVTPAVAQIPLSFQTLR